MDKLEYIWLDGTEPTTQLRSLLIDVVVMRQSGDLMEVQQNRQMVVVLIVF